MEIEEIREALARGYCTERNKNKVMDPELVEDMAQEIFKLFVHPQLGIDITEGLFE